MVLKPRDKEVHLVILRVMWCLLQALMMLMVTELLSLLLACGHCHCRYCRLLRCPICRVLLQLMRLLLGMMLDEIIAQWTELLGASSATSCSHSSTCTPSPSSSLTIELLLVNHGVFLLLIHYIVHGKLSCHLLILLLTGLLILLTAALARLTRLLSSSVIVILGRLLKLLFSQLRLS